MIDKELLDILVCPLTHDPLRLEGDKLVNTKWGLKYPIENDIPVLLIERAELPEGVDSLEQLQARIDAEKQKSNPDSNPT